MLLVEIRTIGCNYLFDTGYQGSRSSNAGASNYPYHLQPHLIGQGAFGQ